MICVCDGCGRPLDRMVVPGDKARAIRATDLGLCWDCAGSGSWGEWEAAPVAVVAKPIGAFARWLNNRKGNE